MIKLTTWLKRTGGVVIACLLLSLVVAPAVDAAICGVEPSSAESLLVVEETASLDAAGDEHGQGDVDACLHGHCHHATPLIGAQAMQTGALAIVHARLTPAIAGLPPSRASDRLNKPPRA